MYPPKASISKKGTELFGFRKVKNLKGGINAWAEEVDPTMPIY